MVRIRIGRAGRGWRRPLRLLRRAPVPGPLSAQGRPAEAPACRPADSDGGDHQPNGLPAFDPLAEFDTAEDVEVLFHVSRRSAFALALGFVVVTLGAAALGTFWPPWYDRPLFSGMTSHLLTLTVVLPAVGIGIGLIYRNRLDRLEDQVMGRWEEGESR